MGDEKKGSGRLKSTISVTKRDAANNLIVESRYIEVETARIEELEDLLKKAVSTQKELEGGD